MLNTSGSADNVDSEDFDVNMQQFYLGLAESLWDKAVVSLLNMESIVKNRGVDEATQQCRAEILLSCQQKIKLTTLSQLQQFIDHDNPAKAIVIWEKTKVHLLSSISS